MDRAELINILNDWNFWKKDLDTGIKRNEYLTRLSQIIKTNEIIVITGIRRCGKSTILQQFCKDLIGAGIRKEDILIVNLEDPRFKGLNLELLNQIYELYLTELNPGKKHYVILDEVQVIDGWEKFARYLHENKKLNVFVTGSSSKLLSSEYSTVLAGRHLDISINVLGFKEYLSFRGIEIKTALDISAKRHEIKRAFYSYLEWGGFPKIALLEAEKDKRELLSTYFKDIIIKDVVMRHKIKEIDKLEDLAKYYLTNISTLQSFNKLKNILSMNLDTVERFSYYLEEAYLLSFVRKFSYKKKEQILNPKKVYSRDIGLRNSVAFLFSKDRIRLFENLVFNELSKEGDEVYYWKQKHEVDFVIKKGQKIAKVIQVCWDLTDPDTKKREVAGLIECCKAIRLKKGLILTEDYSAEENIVGITIIYLPFWQWLLEKK